MKISKFRRGLKDELKKALIGVAVPATLEQFELKVIQIDNDLHEYNLERKNPKSKTSSIRLIPSNNRSATITLSTSVTPHPTIPGTEVVPMEVNATFQNQIKLTADERKRQIDGKLCMYARCNIKNANILAQHKNGCPVKNSIRSSGKGRSV